jgi:hypothetical protein
VRLATRAAEPAIEKLIQELAEFEELLHACLRFERPSFGVGGAE